MSSKAPFSLDEQEPGPGMDNLRDSGERKFPERPDAGDRQAGDFLADVERGEAANKHLMEGGEANAEMRRDDGKTPAGSESGDADFAPGWNMNPPGSGSGL